MPRAKVGVALGNGMGDRMQTVLLGGDCWFKECSGAAQITLDSGQAQHSTS